MAALCYNQSMTPAQAAKPDLPGIMEVNKALHLDIPNFKWDQENWIADQISQGNFYVVKDGDKVCAAMCVTSQPNGLLIESMAVHQEHQSQGMGKTMLDFARQLARQQKCQRLMVISFSAHGLELYYKSMGFQPDEPYTENYEGEELYRFVTLV